MCLLMKKQIKQLVLPQDCHINIPFSNQMANKNIKKMRNFSILFYLFLDKDISLEVKKICASATFLRENIKVFNSIISDKY